MSSAAKEEQCTMRFLNVECDDECSDVGTLWKDMLREIDPGSEPDWLGFINELRAGGNTSETSGALIALVKSHYDPIGQVAIGFAKWFIYTSAADGLVHGNLEHLYVMPLYRDRKIAEHLRETAIITMRLSKIDVVDVVCKMGQVEYWRSLGFTIDKYQMSMREGD